MPHNAEISRLNPTAFLFLVDQSGSMEDNLSTGRTKAQQVADVLNRTLATLITRCTKSEGTRDYFEIGVLSYGGSGVQNGFQGALGSATLNPISKVEANPLRIDERKQRMDDGVGGLVERAVKFPVWFEPTASGGTPMCQALVKCAEELAIWCDAHPGSYPPTVLHITDGASTDGNPETLAKQLCEIQTSDGPVLMFNLHLTPSASEAILFPDSEHSLSGDFAKLLFRMSSPLPSHLIRYAQEKSINVGMESRGFIFNGDAVQIVDFFDIGTRATQMR